jgi:hypothetical protein
MRVFIDTEFTDFKPMYLISIGMVADTGAEFYAETSFPLDACSDFVKEVVLPQLGRKRDRIFDRQQIGIELMQWLEAVRPAGEDLEICFDFYADGDLLVAALDQPLPGWCRLRNVWSHIDDLAVERYFRQTGNSDHHALNDARANQFAYRADVKKEAP